MGSLLETGEKQVDWKNLLIDQLNRVYAELTATIDGLDPELIVHPDSGVAVAGYSGAPGGLV